MVLGDTPQAESAPPAAKLSFYQAAFQRLLKAAGRAIRAGFHLYVVSGFSRTVTGPPEGGRYFTKLECL